MLSARAGKVFALVDLQVFFFQILLMKITDFPEHNITEGCLVLVGKDVELDVIVCQFQPYPYHRMHLHADDALVVLPGMLFPDSRGIIAA